MRLTPCIHRLCQQGPRIVELKDAADRTKKEGWTLPANFEILPGLSLFNDDINFKCSVPSNQICVKQVRKLPYMWKITSEHQLWVRLLKETVLNCPFRDWIKCFLWISPWVWGFLNIHVQWVKQNLPKLCQWASEQRSWPQPSLWLKSSIPLHWLLAPPSHQDPLLSCLLPGWWQDYSPSGPPERKTKNNQLKVRNKKKLKDRTKPLALLS